MSEVHGLQSTGRTRNPDSRDLDGVCVLGAGLAGLGFASRIPQARIFEASPHAGGHAYSHPLGGFHFDEGAHISHTKDVKFLELIYAAAGDVHSFEPSVVRNFWNGHWIGYPVQNHLRDLPLQNRVQGLSDLVMSHIQQDVNSDAATYREWCEMQYGSFLTDTFYEVFTEKYWRRSCEELATDWVGGRLIPSDVRNIVQGAFTSDVEAQASFTRFHYPQQGGFFSFFETLYEPLSIHYGHRAHEIDTRKREIRFENGTVEPYDALATSIPLPELIRAIKDPPSSVRDAATNLHHTELLCVNVVVDEPGLTDLHWCYVYDHSIEPARISFPSNLAPDGDSSKTAIQAEVFRDHRESWDAQAIFERTIDQLGTMFGFNSDDVLAADRIHVPYAYVVSDHDRAKSVAHILRWLDGVGVHTMGLYGTWEYMWSDRAFESGTQAAEKLVAGRI